MYTHATPEAVNADLRALSYRTAEDGRPGWLATTDASDAAVPAVRVEHPQHIHPAVLDTLAERLAGRGWLVTIQPGWLHIPGCDR